MYFTQEDYRKIEAYLKSKAVRDTSFDSATTPLQGNETIVLVQGGKNVNTTVSDIVSQFFALGVSDFINVTDKYGISYNTLDEAIRVIPWRSRKVGQVITFLNEQGEWHLYQYQGESILTWNNTTLWVDLLESRIVNSILPDQEDLTMTEPDADGNSYMHFKDKDYSIDDFSGLGRVYLRKNLQTLTDPNTGETRLINYLTQTMVGKENVIYHIQYDYNLNGQTIIIPEGCVLLFEGGSISNGTLTGNNTIIKTALNSIFNNINISGTYNSDLYLSYWGITSTTDIAPIVEMGLYSLQSNRKKFIIDVNCYINSYASIPSYSDLYINSEIVITSSGNGGFTVMNRGTSVYKYSGATNVIIHGEGTFDFNSRNTQKSTNSAIQLYHCSNIIIEGITFKDPASYHIIEIGGSENITIKNCSFLGFRPIANPALPALSIKGEAIQIEHTLSGNGGIPVPYFDNVECTNIIIEDNLFDGLYSFDANGNKIYDTYMWRAIGNHEDHVGDPNQTYHTNVIIRNNIFNSIRNICISPRYINNCSILNNHAYDLQGIFVSGLPVGVSFYNVPFNFDDVKIVGNIIEFDPTVTANTLVSSIYTVGRNNWGAIDLIGNNRSIIEDNEIYNAPNSSIILNCCPNTLILNNKFYGWNTIDKNKGAATNNRAAIDIMDDTPSESNEQVKETTKYVSMSGNMFTDTWETFPIRPFTRNKVDIEESWNIVDNIFNIANPAWRFVPPTTLNALNLSTFGSAIVNEHPIWNKGFKGKSFTKNDDGRNIYFDGTTWLNEDGTLTSKVVII